MSSPATAPRRFVCSSCGTSLVVTDSDVAVSGPCPKCAAWIDAARFQHSETPHHVHNVRLPDPAASAKRRSPTITGGKGRVRADGYLDHEYSERKELHATLRVMAVSLAVLAIIFFCILYMKEWMGG